MEAVAVFLAKKTKKQNLLTHARVGIALNCYEAMAKELYKYNWTRADEERRKGADVFSR